MNQMICSTISVPKQVCVDLGAQSRFEPFIMEAVVSLLGSDKRVPIKVLHVTGVKHSFIVEHCSVLPFSSDTKCGISDEIQSDQGSDFTFHLIKTDLTAAGSKTEPASAYHAQNQGALEWSHQTLVYAACMWYGNGKGLGGGNAMSHVGGQRGCSREHWFSPNDLVFGHGVRGPLAFQRDGFVESEQPKNLVVGSC